jgi:N-ethylmaleimide reductase
VMQLWHTGRSSHPSVQPGGILPVGPSPIAIDGLTFANEGRVPFVAPRELRIDEIPGLVEDYAAAARRAMAAGFDGVEIHGANGYLPDQFLHSSSNVRTDEYGGTIENRARFMLEVVVAVCAASGPGRTGLRLSPTSTFNDMFDSDSEALYAHLLERLAEHPLAYLHVVEPGVEGGATTEVVDDTIDSAWVRERWSGGLVSVGNHTRDSAVELLGRGVVDAVAFGRPFIANPDLVRRLVEDLPLEPSVREVFYGGTDHGYINYPTWDEQQAGVPVPTV